MIHRQTTTPAAAQRSQEVRCGEPDQRQHPDHSGGCLADPKHTAREGKGDPSCLRAALQLHTGCGSPSRPARDRRNRAGHTAPRCEQLRTSREKPHQSHHTASPMGLFRPYPVSRSRDGTELLPLPRLILQLSAYCTDRGLCRARQEDSQPCFMCLVVTFGDLFRRSSYMKGARQGCQPKPGFRISWSNY